MLLYPPPPPAAATTGHSPAAAAATHRPRAHRRSCRATLTLVCRAWAHLVRTSQRQLTVGGHDWHKRPASRDDILSLLAAAARRPQVTRLHFLVEPRGDWDWEILVLLLPHLPHLRELSLAAGVFCQSFSLSWVSSAAAGHRAALQPLAPPTQASRQPG